MDCIEAFVPSFSLQAEEYELKEDLERFHDKLISMSRKHGLLQKQAEESKTLYEQKLAIWSRSGNFNDYKEMMTAQKKHQTADDAFSAYNGDYKKIQEQMDEIKMQLQKCEKRRSLLEEEVKKTGITKTEDEDGNVKEQ